MTFSFQPLTDEEIEMMGLVPEGEYRFEVAKATSKMSNGGNPMIELVLKVWDKNGSEQQVYDYLVSTPKMMFKVKHFCDSVGLTQEYLKGHFQDWQCTGKSGRAYIVVTKGKPNDEGGMYPDKNSVRDYIKSTTNNIGSASASIALPALTPKAEPEHDDDIPF